jgi:anhydro-N-acetylmuramic acid kinase
MKFRPIRIVGVMTGTSCDGLDASCVEFCGATEFKVLWNESRPYSPRLRERALNVQKPGTKLALKEMLALEGHLGRWYARTIQDVLRDHEAPDVISNHGQTLAHFPETRASWQAGDPAEIAFETGITVVSHLRQGDLAARGDGAPLVPAFHRVLAQQLRPPQGEGIAIHNIGGVSNLTYVGSAGTLLAFDTGPGGFWIDAAVSKVTQGKHALDRDGAMARQGKADMQAVHRLMSHPYFKRKPPKSTGRDEFPFYLLSKATRAQGNDLVATATALTVESIAAAYEKFILKKGLPLESIWVSGGGEKNLFLMERLQERLKPVQVHSLSDRQNYSPQYVEAQAFAYLGWLTLLGLPLGGSWTGAKPHAPPGRITPGRNWLSLVSLLAENPVWAQADAASERLLSKPRMR